MTEKAADIADVVNESHARGPKDVSAPVAAAPTPQRRLLIQGADIITMECGEEDMAATDVLVEGGKIVAIGRSLPSEGAEVIDASGMILMPGMVDCHRHVWETIDMGSTVPTYQKNYKHYHEWKMRIMPAMNPEDGYHGEYVGCLEAIDSGVTTLVDFSHGLHTQEMALAGARGVIDSGIAGFFCWQVAHVLTYGLNQEVPRSQGWEDRNALPTEMHWQTSRILRDKYFGAGASPMQFGMALSNSSMGRKMTDVIEEFRRARSLEPKLITHHVRSKRADPQYPEGYFRSIKDLADAGLIGSDYHLTHANDWSDEELKIMANHGGKICSTPSVETLHVYSQTAVFGRFSAVGGNAGLGLDVPHGFSRDYFEMLRVAFWSLCRTEQSRKIADTYTSRDMLSFVTREAAKSINLGDEAGTIKVGKWADLVLLRTDRIGFPDWGTISDRIVNFASLQDVDSVWIRGVRRKTGGRMIGIDWGSLKRETFERQTRINRDAATVIIT